MMLENLDPSANATGTSRPGDTRRLGWITVAAGALGVACAAGVLLTSPMVAITRFSHPFDSTWFVITQLIFAVQHAAMIAGVLGLAAIRPSSSRGWRPGLIIAGSGLVLLIACELFALSATTATNDSTIATAVSTAYALPTVLVGVGFLLLGWVIARRRLVVWGQWLPFLFGLYVFVILMPALLGPSAAGRLALGGWMALYALLGVLLLRGPRR